MTAGGQEESQTTKSKQELGRGSAMVCRHQGSHRGASLKVQSVPSLEARLWGLGMRMGAMYAMPLLGLKAWPL